MKQGFGFFFIVLFDLHNLSRQGKLRSVANPKSSLRWELLGFLIDVEPSLIQSKNENIDIQTESSMTQSKSRADICEPSAEETRERELEDITNNINKMTLNQYICNICGAKYKVPWTLKSHMVKKNKHIISCKFCNDKFDDQLSHDIHMSNHSFSCSECGITLFDKETLEKHKQTHILICDYCKELFLDKEAYCEHKKIHLICKVCTKKCENMKQLNRHVATHK